MLHKMYMMFCCTSCVSNGKEDDLIKGHLLNLDTVSLWPAFAFGWFFVVSHAVWTHVVSYDPTPSTRGCCARVWWWRSEWFNQSMMDTKVVELSAAILEHVFFKCCNILWNLVKIKHYIRDTIWRVANVSMELRFRFHNKTLKQRSKVGSEN